MADDVVITGGDGTEIKLAELDSRLEDFVLWLEDLPLTRLITIVTAILEIVTFFLTIFMMKNRS